MRILLSWLLLLGFLSSPQLLDAQCSETRWSSARAFSREGDSCAETAQLLFRQAEGCYSNSDNPLCPKAFEALLCSRDNYMKAVLQWQELAGDCTGNNRENAGKYASSILQTLFVQMQEIFTYAYLHIPYHERKVAVETFDPRVYKPLYDIGAQYDRFLLGSLNAAQMNVVKLARTWYELANEDPAEAKKSLAKIDGSHLPLECLQILAFLERQF